MTAQEIRQKFLQFFSERGHTIVPSSPLVPYNDPSVLLTPAGMQQFKPYFLGEPSPFGNRVASIQKSFRTSDIEAVGDNTHLTFFEMLGNFSFNFPKGEHSYFKEEAIGWGLEFVQDVLEIARQRIKASVFGGDKEVPMDTESIAIWKKQGFTDRDIMRGNRKDNFWGPTGNEGPCGPTSEIYVDGVEVWNLVFNEYHQDREGTLNKLAARGVDTGAGLERLAQVIQGKKSPYETDLFHPIMTSARNAIPFIDDRSVRITADHIKASVFLVADGVQPSNKEQGYMLRRLIRRSTLLAKRGQGTEHWYAPIVGAVIKEFGAVYPDLMKQRERIPTVIHEEVRKFNKTLQRGLQEFERLEKSNVVSGQDAFRLYETYGFPIELTEELAKTRGKSIDRSGFEKERSKHRKVSGAGAGRKFGGHGLLTAEGKIVGAKKEDQQRITRLHTATHLLHQALRDVFGDTVQQMGSDINSERLRFDFSHDRKLSPEEVKRVESIVNQKVHEHLPVYRKELTREEAQKTGALAFFRDKYGGTVSVYFIGSGDPLKAYSKEFCAGPHVTNTAAIGSFKLLKEEAVGSNVRRIKAAVL